MNDIKPIKFCGVDSKRPVVIAGPCSAETEEQVMETAKDLAKNGVRIFRAGIWKPRTKPGGFEGVGSVGLTWLQEVKKETGMLVATEVANKQHVEEALNAGVDVLWIGARTSANPFAMQEIADSLVGADVPVLVKNPVNPDLELWIGAMQRIYNAGIRQIGGKRELVAPLSQQAMDMGFDGLIVESHCDPDSAWSDKSQQVTPEVLNFILNMLVVRDTTQTTESLTLLRQQIDQIDNDLLEALSKRMRISREIGQYKKEHSMPVVQTGRYDDILNSRAAAAEELGMNGDFMKTVYQAIHEESVRQQIEVLNNRMR